MGEVRYCLVAFYPIPRSPSEDGDVEIAQMERTASCELRIYYVVL